MVAKRRGFRDTLAEECRRDRHASAERLANGHQIGFEAKYSRVEGPPGASEAALDLVGDEERACARARLFDRVGHRLAEGPDPALTLQRLEDDGAS